ncbi:MAG: DUF3710 domain-containing protein [Nocardioides sp.]
MRLRRKGSPGTDGAAVDQAGAQGEPDSAADPRRGGPWDISEVPDDDVERVDLGSLLISPQGDRELRLQVDEQTQSVQAVLIAGPDGALELRAFAAPRGGDLWGEARTQIAAETAQRGGTATERDGRYGAELMCELTVQRPDGTSARQPSRVVGVNGPRWLLRATFLGRPAVEPDAAAAWEDTLASVVVNRGSQAMPPGDPLPLTLPAEARRVT